jgi:hypothetical protein
MIDASGRTVLSAEAVRIYDLVPTDVQHAAVLADLKRLVLGFHGSTMHTPALQLTGDHILNRPAAVR